MKTKTAYYAAFGLKDGTVYTVLPIRKPEDSQHGRATPPDPEGICNFNIEDGEKARDMPDWLRTTFHTTIATSLNIRKLAREQVVSVLGRLESKLATVQEQLDRVLKRLDH